jgi:hypothetical protein
VGKRLIVQQKRPSRPWEWANDLLFNKKRPSRSGEWANDLLFDKKTPSPLRVGKRYAKKDPVALESGQTIYCSTNMQKKTQSPLGANDWVNFGSLGKYRRKRTTYDGRANPRLTIKGNNFTIDPLSNLACYFPFKFCIDYWLTIVNIYS